MTQLACHNVLPLHYQGYALFHPLMTFPRAQGCHADPVHLDLQASVTPGIGWNPRFQPVLKGPHMKRHSCYRSPVRTLSPRQPSGKDHWNQWSPYNLTLLQLEQTTGSSGQRGTGPPTEPGFSQCFFSVLSPMEFWFLAVVASGLLSWGHFLSSDITDLTAQILFKLN